MSFALDFFNPLSSSKSTLHQVEQTVRGVKAFVTLLFDESGSLEPVWELSNSLLDSSAFELAIAQMKANPAVAAILAERYIAPPPDLEALLHYPPESLGYIYAQSMLNAGLQPFSPPIAILSDVHYVEYRWQQTHDIWHVVTGFDVSEAGEIGLQAFYLAQFQLPLASLLIANSLIAATVLQPTLLNSILNAIAQGWQMGKQAQPLIAQRWELAWEKPLEQWRSELNVSPVRYRFDF